LIYSLLFIDYLTTVLL